MKNKPDILKAHKHSSRHRDELSKGQQCGCFFCLAIFEYKNITDWCDDDNTALCPACGIDSVIGSESGFPVSRDFLTLMKRYWFSGTE